MREVGNAVIVPPAGRRTARRLRMAVLDDTGQVVPEADCGTDKVTSAGFVPAPSEAVAQVRLEGTWVFGGLASHHFGHQITRSLGRLHALAAVPAPQGLVFAPLDRRALTRDSTAGLRRLLDGLGIALPFRIVTVPTAVERLVVAPDLFGEATGGHADLAYVAWSRRAFLPPYAAPEPGRKLYVTRSRLGPGVGRILCEAVLEENLSRLGFTVLAPEAHGLRDQLAAYAAAGTIVTTDGSAAHLMAFARRSGQTVAVVARRAARPALILNHLESYGAGLQDSAVHYFGRVSAEWWPESRADNLSLAEIDFAGLAGDLAAAGVIPGHAVAGWHIPSPQEMAEARAHAAPAPARLLSDAERAAFLRARRARGATRVSPGAAGEQEPAMPEAPAPDTETAPPADPQPEPRPGRKARRAMAAEVAGDRVQGMRYLPFLKALHARQRPEWYLEIGTFKGRSLRLVGCNYVAVDPAFRLTDVPPLTGQEMTFFRGTSDAFFAGDRAKSLRGRIDLAFLDGLHHYEVLLRDVINVEPLMARDGIIVLHDCLPGSLASASRVHTPGLDWAGDVWKTLLILQRERPDLRIDVLDCAPTGLVLLRGFSPARARSMKRRHAALCAEWDGVSLETLPGGLDGFYERQRLQNARDALSGIGS